MERRVATIRLNASVSEDSVLQTRALQGNHGCIVMAMMESGDVEPQIFTCCVQVVIMSLESTMTNSNHCPACISIKCS